MPKPEDRNQDRDRLQLKFGQDIHILRKLEAYLKRKDHAYRTKSSFIKHAIMEKLGREQ